MKKYKAVIFDLFDTIVNFNRLVLPVIYVDKAKIHSTCNNAWEVYKKYFADADFEKFYKAFIESYTDLDKIKQIDHKEFPNSDRFKIVLQKLCTEPSSYSEGLIEEMVLAHMKGIADAIEFPDENRDTLDELKEKYRLGLISNFDHTPTAIALLEKFGIKDYFDTIIISVDAGWRKPKAAIFKQALDFMKLEPEDAIFIGDNYNADVVGAKSVGMDAVWINKNKEEAIAGAVKPDHIVSKLAEIGKFL